MKINLKNTSAVDKLLAESNGRALAHVYVNVDQVRRDMLKVEASLADFGLTKRDRPGCSVVLTSGEKLPSSYKYAPIRTELRIDAFPTGWFITGIRVFEQSAYRPVISLFDEQAAAARESKMNALNIRVAGS